jgi:dihydrofolate reductase
LTGLVFCSRKTTGPGMIPGASEAVATTGELAMRKVILFVQVSLDGFFEGPKKEIDWHMVDDELFAHIIEELKAMGGFLYGRISYELMTGFWPTADARPREHSSRKEFARIWRDMPKVVYSKTLASARWNTTIARDVVPGEVEEFKLRANGDLVVGGGDLAAAFMGQDLIDEYRIYVHPIQIGEGKRLFPLRRRRSCSASPRPELSGTGSSFSGTNDSGPMGYFLSAETSLGALACRKSSNFSRAELIAHLRHLPPGVLSGGFPHDIGVRNIRDNLPTVSGSLDHVSGRQREFDHRFKRPCSRES